MGLNIRLLHGDKCVINGAVITCKSQRTTLSVENFAQVIRAPEILDEKDVSTPTERVYFAVQLMLLEPARHDHHRIFFNTVMAQLLYAFENGEVLQLLHEAIAFVEEEDFYQALKRLKRVLDYEKDLLGQMPALEVAG
ncbi:flagellar biosynthesis repressor FlbT [Tepidicaulis sp.]|uniref:flagellar biosynthesis repressor FlbT n=1 Tax=Tepidicaulis sp. TaxID=1920809 RepID=UPI003B599065